MMKKLPPQPALTAAVSNAVSFAGSNGRKERESGGGMTLRRRFIPYQAIISTSDSMPEGRRRYESVHWAPLVR